MAGDEFGNSQEGNNNAYCQDNEISWLDWRLAETNRQQLEFVRGLIAFRKAHPVFHMDREPRIMDYRSCGRPIYPIMEKTRGSRNMRRSAGNTRSSVLGALSA